MLEKDIPQVKPFIDLTNKIVSESGFCKLTARGFFLTKEKGTIVVPEKEWSEKKSFYKDKLRKTQNDLIATEKEGKKLDADIKVLQKAISTADSPAESDKLFDELNILSDKKAHNETMVTIYKKDLEFTQSRYNKLISKDKLMKQALSHSKLIANLTYNLAVNDSAVELFMKDMTKLEAVAQEDNIELWQAMFKYIGRSEAYEELAMNNDIILKTSDDVLHIYYNFLLEIRGKKEEDLTEDMFIPPEIKWDDESTIDAYCAYWQNIYNNLEEYYKSSKELKGDDKQILAEILKFLYMCILSKGSIIHTYNQSKEKMYLDYNAFSFHYNKLIVPVANELLKGTNKLDPKYHPILFTYVLLLLNKSNNIIGVIELM